MSEHGNERGKQATNLTMHAENLMESKMEIIRKSVGEVPVVEVHGQIDLSNCYHLSDAFNEELESGRVNIIADLSKVSYIDSACLGVLLSSLEKIKANDGMLSVVGNPLIDRVFALTGLSRVFPFHADVDAALADLTSGK